MDGSGSIDGQDFALEKTGLAAAIRESIVVPRDGTFAVGLVQFSNGARTEFPLTVVDSESAADALIDQIGRIQQIDGGTNPAAGIAEATALLGRFCRSDATQHFCLITDGTPAVDVGASLAHARESACGLESFGVMAIEDVGSFAEEDAEIHYRPHVFGGGTITFVSGAAEFASLVGPTCFGSAQTALKLVGLEVVQTVQDWNNSVPLVANKLTYVRAHVEPAEKDVEEILATARLRGSRGNVALPESPLTPINEGGGRVLVQSGAEARRGAFARSLNFRLPQSWTSGSVRLELQGVGAAIDCSESASPGCTVNVDFIPVDPIQVKFVGIRYDQADGSRILPPDAQRLEDLRDRLLAVFPVSDIDLQTATTNLTKATDPPTDAEIFSRMAWLRQLDACSSDCDRIYYGVLLGSGPGAAYCPGQTGFGYLPAGKVYGYNRHAHEVAHSMGFNHAPYCGATLGECSFTLTYDTAMVGQEVPTLGPLPDSGGRDELVYGLDTKSVPPTVIDPHETFALMGYCGATIGDTRRWISKVLYESLITEINSVFAPANGANGGAPEEEYTFFRGIVDLDTGDATLLPLRSLATSSPPSLIPGDYALELMDAAGDVIDSISFGVQNVVADASQPGGDGPSPRIGLFMVALPSRSEVKGTNLMKGAEVLASRVASPNPPSVRIDAPVAGATLSGASTTLRWTGNDADGDVLAYDVQYSSDGGQTWETLVVDWPDQELEIELAQLPGTNDGRIRVIATDGFATAASASGRFSVENKAPRVSIVSPANRSAFFGVQLITFAALVEDLEDGRLEGNSVEWHSDIDGLLGQGLNFDIRADFMTPNEPKEQHTITVRATDRQGRSSTASVLIAIEVLPQQVLPFIRGDSNGDGRINIADAIWTLNELFGGGPQTDCAAAADVNSDLEVNLADPIALINFRLMGGPPPGTPFPDCGTAPTADCERNTCP